MKIIFSIYACLLALFIKGQSSHAIQLTDSIDLSYINYHITQFDLLNEASPVVLIPQGLFLPKEKLWFYRAPDSSMRIRNFSISHDDTSVFFIVKKQERQYLLQIHKTGNTEQEVKNLLELDSARYITYPTGAGQLFLSGQKSSFKIFRINNSVPSLLTEKAAITGIFAADTSGIMLNYGNHVNFLRLNGTEDTLFCSPLLIKDVSLTESGVFIISTAAGVFYFSKGLTPEPLNNKISDGVIKIAGHNVWVLSDAEKKIYKYTISE
jgi:hypothetical protein